MILTTTLPLLLWAGVNTGNGTNGEPPTGEPTTPPVQAADDEPRWKGKADFGYTMISGNNESTTAAFNAELRYEAEWYKMLYYAKYAGVRQTDRGTGDANTTSRLYTAGGQYDRFLDDEKNLYAYGNGNYRKNVPNGLDLRWTVGVGAGYTWYLTEDKETLFALEAGPSFIHEENVGVADEVDALSGRAAARYENPIFDDLQLVGTAEYLQSFDESEDRSFLGELAVDWEPSEQSNWYVRASAAVAWDNTPAAGFETTDRIYVVSVGYSF